MALCLHTLGNIMVVSCCFSQTQTGRPISKVVGGFRIISFPFLVPKITSAASSLIHDSKCFNCILPPGRVSCWTMILFIKCVLHFTWSYKDIFRWKRLVCLQSSSAMLSCFLAAAFGLLPGILKNTLWPTRWTAPLAKPWATTLPWAIFVRKYLEIAWVLKIQWTQWMNWMRPHSMLSMVTLKPPVVT